MGDIARHLPRPTTNQEVAGSSPAERANVMLAKRRKKKSPVESLGAFGSSRLQKRLFERYGGARRRAVFA
jgi:hypothetical protein